MSEQIDISQLATDFLEVSRLADVPVGQTDLRMELLSAPHKRPSSLPSGSQAVYAFMLGHCCLKVGKAGPKTVARFTSQHYGFNAPSTLAKSILADRDALPGCLPIDANAAEFLSLAADDIGNWIENYTSRLNVYLPASSGKFTLALLEAFVQCRLKPSFEGKRT